MTSSIASSVAPSVAPSIALSVAPLNWSIAPYHFWRFKCMKSRTDVLLNLDLPSNYGHSVHPFLSMVDCLKCPVASGKQINNILPFPFDRSIYEGSLLERGKTVSGFWRNSYIYVGLQKWAHNHEKNNALLCWKLHLLKKRMVKIHIYFLCHSLCAWWPEYNTAMPVKIQWISF